MNISTYWMTDSGTCLSFGPLLGRCRFELGEEKQKKIDFCFRYMLKSWDGSHWGLPSSFTNSLQMFRNWGVQLLELLEEKLVPFFPASGFKMLTSSVSLLDFFFFLISWCVKCFQMMTGWVSATTTRWRHAVVMDAVCGFAETCKTSLKMALSKCEDVLF